LCFLFMTRCTVNGVLGFICFVF